MDKNVLTVLAADIESQMALIERVYAEVDKRAAGLGRQDAASLESTAYQLHNLYNAVEDLLKIIAAHFENQVADTARWHTALLQRMAQDIPGIRPAVLSETSQQLLHSLRGFRHFFRHAYGASIEYAQLEINLDKARQLRPRLQADIDRFLGSLGIQPATKPQGLP